MFLGDFTMEAPVIAALITAFASLFGTIVSAYVSLKAKKDTNDTSNQQKALYQSMTSLFSDNQEVLEIFAENIDDLVQKQKVEDYIDKLNKKNKALQNIFEEIPIWDEASNWLNSARDKLEENAIKSVLKQEPSLQNSGRELDSKEKRQRFNKNFQEHIDWISRCLNLKTTRIPFEKSKLMTVNNYNVYKLAFESMKINIENIHNSSSRNKSWFRFIHQNKKPSKQATKIVIDFLDYFIEKYS